MDVFRAVGGLVLVLALLGGFLWMLRRMQTGLRPGGLARRMQVLEVVSVGPRQKIALVRVGEREVLVGVSPNQLTALGSWPGAAEAMPAPDSGAASPRKFSLETPDAP
jgi:flagellar protein FliO/FliZ